jgi:hypothetical protein
MRGFAAKVVFLACALFGAVTMVSAQTPPAAAPQAGAPAAPGRGAAAPLQNIKVLPKTWTRQQVGALMQSFTKSLGVMCDGCHIEGNDRASDANPNKDVARKMMQMVMDINGDHLKGSGDAAVTEKVSCWTCHQGQKTPAFAPPDGWGRGAFSLSEAGPTLPARGAGAGPGPGAGAPPAGAPPAGAPPAGAPARGN